MSSEGLLGKFKSLLGVLDTTGLEVLDDSLFVGRYSTNLSDDLPDKFNSLSEAALAAGGLTLLDELFGNFEFGHRVSLVLSNGDDCWVAFCHS
jgi:hypothetical protein